MAIIEAQVIMVYLLKNFEVEAVNLDKIGLYNRITYMPDDENLIKLRVRKN